MRDIKADAIKNKIAELCIEANFRLRPDVLKKIKSSYRAETGARPKKILKAIIENAEIARKENLAICQDTGLPVVFMEIGQDAHVSGGPLAAAVNEGVESGYKKAFLRNSVVNDPLLRGKSGYVPAIIHIEITNGSKIKLTVLPKGFGCENKGQVKMFRPTTDLKRITEFIVDVVRQAGPDACPPYVVGVGIGGTQDYACLMAKKALLKKVTDKPSKLEHDLLKEINNLKIGPMGLGGKTTALAVSILTRPTHIAGLPVCVNISCHATRSASATL
jgi:fumarate hydratase subunit alpha